MGFIVTSAASPGVPPRDHPTACLRGGRGRDSPRSIVTMLRGREGTCPPSTVAAAPGMPISARVCRRLHGAAAAVRRAGGGAGGGAWRRLGRDPLGRLAEGAVELELGDVVLADGGGVLLVGGVQRDRSPATTSWGRTISRSSSPAGRVVSRRPMKFLSADSIAWRTPSSVSTTRTRAVCKPGDGLRDLGLDPEDGPRQLDRRQLLLGPPLPDPADVADPPFCNCQTAATSMSKRAPLEFSEPFGAGGEVAGREQPRASSPGW